MTQTSSAHPDADLHPEATGLAASTVKAHSSDESLKLYAGWFCPFVQRVWLVLEEKGIPYQYIEVNPYHKPATLMELNPRGLIPTLQYDDRPLYESNVICEFLEDAYPQYGPSLHPAGLYEKARGRIWTDFITSRIIPSFHRFLQFQPTENEELESAERRLSAAREEFLDHIMDFTKQMDKSGPFFWGSEPTLTDFALIPWAVRFWVFDHFKNGCGIPSKDYIGADSNVWKRWRKWLAAVEQRESVKRTTSERRHYLPIYQRYADDKAMSELAKATRLGKGVP